MIEPIVAHLDILQSLLEGKAHPTANDQGVDLLISSTISRVRTTGTHLVQHVLDQLNLVRHFGTTEDSQERPLGALEHFGKVFKLLLHQEPSGTLRELNADHGRVGTVGSAEADYQLTVCMSGRIGTYASLM